MELSLSFDMVSQQAAYLLLVNQPVDTSQNAQGDGDMHAVVLYETDIHHIVVLYLQVALQIKACGVYRQVLTILCHLWQVYAVGQLLQPLRFLVYHILGQCHHGIIVCLGLRLRQQHGYEGSCQHKRYYDKYFLHHSLLLLFTNR